MRWYGVDMKNLLLLLVAAALLSLTSGCALTEKYNKNNATAQAWLQANDKGCAKTNFEGIYYSPDWGAIVLKQLDSKITGAILHYQIKGIATGKSAYLLLVDDDWAEHTMILRRKSFEVVSGSYSSHMPYVEKGSRTVHLDKIVH